MPAPAPSRAAAVRGPHKSPAHKPAKPTGSADYANCAVARAAGGAPIHRGEPGYHPGLDQVQMNGDGVACE